MSDDGWCGSNRSSPLYESPRPHTRMGVRGQGRHQRSGSTRSHFNGYIRRGVSTTICSPSASATTSVTISAHPHPRSEQTMCGVPLRPGLR